MPGNQQFAPANQAFTPPARAPMAAPAQSDAIDLSPRFRAWSEPGSGGAGPMRCHFLRSVGPDGRLAEAQRTAVPTHRCAAFGDPLPLSLRQQELVCLQRVHVSCPRYVRGTLLASENQPQAEASEERQGGVPIWTIAGVVLVILSLLLVFTDLLGLPPLGGGAGATPSRLAVVSGPPTQTATAAVTVRVTQAPIVTPSARVTESASPTVHATPSATATPAPTPMPSVTWPPGGTASRMDLLSPCPDQSNCWVYTVRGAGSPPAGNGSPVADTLAGIVGYFGVDISTVRDMNSFLNGGSVIHPGDKLKIPTPTKWSS